MAQLSFDECKKILNKHKISLVHSIRIAHTKDLISASKQIEFPLVLKAYSPSLIHKTHEGMVHTNIANEKSLLGAYAALKKRLLGHRITDASIIVQHQVFGHEFIIGAKKDETFGPVVLIGLGGIYTELLKRTTLHICPLSKKQAVAMVNELAGSLIDRTVCAELSTLLFKIGTLIEIEPIKEMDLNPVIVCQHKTHVVDMRMVS